MAEGPRIVSGLTSITPGPTSVAGQGQNPPPLPQLASGATLSGSVIGLDAKGNPVIRTETLQLVISTRFPLQKGNHVSLRLEGAFTRDAQPNIRILNIDGKTPAELQSAAQSPQQQTANAQTTRPIGVLLEAIMHKTTGEQAEASRTPQAASAPPREAATQVKLSGQLEAVLLRPAANPKLPVAVQNLLPANASPATQPMGTWLRPGLQMQVQVAHIESQPVTTPAQARPNPAGISGYAFHGKTSVPTPTAGAATPAQPHTMPRAPTGFPHPPNPPTPETPAAPDPSVSRAVGSSVSAPSLPPSTPPNATPVLSPTQVHQALQQAVQQGLPQGQVPAIVVGSEKNGTAIIQTQLGTFSLQQAGSVATQALPTGTMLHLEVKSVQLPDAALSAGRMPQPLESTRAVSRAAQLTADWSALSELVRTLQGMETSQAAQALQRVVPHIGSNMTAGMVFFLSVIRKGDVTQWLGKDLVDQLERMGKGELVQRLGADMAALRAVWGEQQPQTNWQALFFPVMVDKEMQQARLFVKREPDDKKEGGAGTRFVVEVELSNLGAMQLDGLVKKREGRQFFDLVIRSQQALEERIQEDIQAIFHNAQEVTGMSGNLYFRQENEFPIHPLEELHNDNGDSGHGSILA